ncbi:MAG: hypothetical protein JNN13_12280 [Planctomycetes bacterium]|nr:hypothetical protein [Planctomycetota bacterium]
MTNERRRALMIVFAGLVLAAMAVRVAWVGDDGYITLRSVENWVSGNGPRWNTMDRVQTYTHPLWMLLLTAARLVTGGCYSAALGLSAVLSLFAIVMLLRRAAGAAGVAAVLLLLASTRTFVDYTTSGLETPLCYALLVLFVAANERRCFGRVVLLASLLTCTRMDLALLCLPAALASMRGERAGAVLGKGALAASPFVAWLGFAVVYYGSPLPVTAHAKAFGTGIPFAAAVQQGLHYLGHAALHDPVLFATVLLGIAVGLADRRRRWLALGALLYVGYVVKVGGDFMAGRFLLPPFVIAVCVLAPRLAGARAIALGLVALGASCAPGLPPWLTSPAGDTPIDAATIEAQHGIVDERRMHYSHGLGLLPGPQPPAFGDMEQQPFWRQVWPEGRQQRWFLINGSVGVAGFQMGARGHLIDTLLCDALLARLPAKDPAHWRIGHVLRRVPEGYFESLASGENRIRHPGLHRYYEALRLATQAPLFARERLAALWALTTGRFDADLRAYLAEHYFTPPRLVVDAAELPRDVALGSMWFEVPALRLVYDGGLAVRFVVPQAAGPLRVQVLGMVAFRYRFVRDGVVLGETMGVPLPPAPELAGLRMIAGLRAEHVEVPAAADGFDTLWLDAVEVPGSETAVGPPALGGITR